jgi:hypothetical protein
MLPKVFESVLKIGSFLNKGTPLSCARKFDPVLVQPVIDFAVYYGVLKSPFSAAQMYEQLGKHLRVVNAPCGGRLKKLFNG